MNSSDFYTQLVDSEFVCVIHMTKRDSIDSSTAFLIVLLHFPPHPPPSPDSSNKNANISPLHYTEVYRKSILQALIPQKQKRCIAS